MDYSGFIFPFVFNNCISVKIAALHSDYNMQYSRRLLRDGSLNLQVPVVPVYNLSL